jgi:hypothetical protein
MNPLDVEEAVPASLDHLGRDFDLRNIFQLAAHGRESSFSAAY